MYILRSKIYFFDEVLKIDLYVLSVRPLIYWFFDRCFLEEAAGIVNFVVIIENERIYEKTLYCMPHDAVG